MDTKDLNIDIELSGYKGRITHIFTREANPIFNKEDQLLFNVEFYEPYPEGIISTAIVIPADAVTSAITIHSEEKQRRVLLAIIKREGDEQIRKSVLRSIEAKAKREKQEQAKGRLENLARQAEAVLKP